jgi:hypothetical protein
MNQAQRRHQCVERDHYPAGSLPCASVGDTLGPDGYRRCRRHHNLFAAIWAVVKGRAAVKERVA